MKTKSARSRLSKFREVQVDHRTFRYSSRFNDTRYVDVIDQNGTAVILPCVIEPDGKSCVVYHAKTLVSAIEFLEGA
jgi:hypothetical protein